MANTIPGVVPTLLGPAAFGDPAEIAASLIVGAAAQEDAFLSLPEGTTQYGLCQDGGAIAITGILVGPTCSSVQTAQQARAAMAGATGPALLPTGPTCRGWDLWSTVWFDAGDLAFSTAGIITVPGNTYQLGYSLMLNRVGGLAT